MANTSGYYTYLASSLPVLYFERNAPFLFEEFLKMCSGIISETDIELLKNTKETSQEGSYPSKLPESEKKWRAFDTCLRNELVKIRASRKHIDPRMFLREGGYAEPSVSHAAMNAYKNPSILERERLLDLERWRALDNISIGHYFDIDFLMIYARKLLILERWSKIRSADGEKILEETLEKSGKN